MVLFFGMPLQDYGNVTTSDEKYLVELQKKKRNYHLN